VVIVRRLAFIIYVPVMRGAYERAVGMAAGAIIDGPSIFNPKYFSFRRGGCGNIITNESLFFFIMIGAYVLIETSFS
jgi:hypothetical protein